MTLDIKLDSRSSLSLSHQLYTEIRRLIVEGRLVPGTRLPSSRELSRELSVSRSTVSQTYDQLSSEGYLQVIAGSGTFISRDLPDEQLRADRVIVPEEPQQFLEYKLSEYAQRIGRLPRFAASGHNLVFGFEDGLLAVDQLPLAEWSRVLAKCVRQAGRKELNYAPSAFGADELREVLAKYLQQQRGVRCTSDQIIIVSGAQQAFDLISRCLFDPGDMVAFEEPGFLAARRTFVANGAIAVPIPVDAAGIDVEQLWAVGDGLRAAHVTPSHQFPTGALLPVPRRMQLLEWARKSHALIIEDDYDSEYCYVGRPSPALQGLDSAGSVIYVGSFSKVLFPSFRLGCMVVPRPLVETFGRAKWLADRQSPTIEQVALAEFIREGFLERHIREMLTLYDGRRRALVQALHLHFRDRVSVLGEQAGMHILIRLKSRLSDDEIIERWHAQGVGPVSTGRYYIGNAPAGEFVMAYAGLSEQVIAEGVGRMARAIMG